VGRGMGLIKELRPVKLIIAMLAKDALLFKKAEMILTAKFGDIDYGSNLFDFDVSNYYRDEIGDKLVKKLISFKRLISPDKLRAIKLYTNNLENKFMNKKKRTLNIDPGYINEGKVVLASTKDNLQRLYLGKGIYGEVTLYLRDGEYQDFIWTYPDYKKTEYKEAFKKIRSLFRKQIGRYHAAE
jgi:hypothetical protein